MAAGRTLLVLAVLGECWIHFMSGSCPAGKFGDSCSYSCHCGHSCNQTTGMCEGDCDRGWVGGKGGTCQKANIAYGKHAVSSPGDQTFWSASKAVDGNRDLDSCFPSKSRPSVWTVDLGQQYRIHDVRIYHGARGPWQIRPSVLCLSNSSSSTPGVPCYTFPNNPATGSSVYDVICDGRGRFFTIKHNWNALNLCEVEIYACSQGTFGANCSHFCHCSDGPCDRVSGICAGDCRPGWHGQNCSLDCDKDQYGVNCNDTCGNRNCAANTSSCDRHTGSCDTGCLPGWTTVDCTQECFHGTYGQNCSKRCTDRNCAGNSSCDHVTGSCVPGCKAGWTGLDCKDACEPHQYAPGCTETCASRHCEGNSSCNSTGGCDNWCEAGWTQSDCTVYSLSHPGTECKEECAGNHPCDRSSGSCRFACLEGNKDHRCQESVGDDGILIPAVAATAIVVLVAAVIVFVFIRRKRQRAPQKEPDSYEYYNTSHLSKVQTKTSRNNDASELNLSAHDYRNVELRDNQWCGEPHCTISRSKTEPDDGASVEAIEVDIYEPVEPRTYETLDSTSRAMAGEYSEFGKFE
ncbi:multiple epidermal growth factor-like domains protein 11 [Haliotis asinina]|uniref:multiple epidermal growth factor-like domains protein 11 n=1 Tax=Haliotis asinina TaxID=109174 RepID=UPI0035318EAB